MQQITHDKRLLGGTIPLLVAALLLPMSLAAQKPPVEKAATVLSPDRTDAGEWAGTWFYKTHKDKWALWMRMENDVPEMKLQYQNYDRGENFISDWTAVSHYASDRKKGLFRLSFGQRDIDVIAGDWFWQLGTPGDDRTVRTETATFDMYRAARGRQLVLRLTDFERIYEGDRVYRLAAQQAWTFHKASRRLVRWEELPF